MNNDELEKLLRKVVREEVEAEASRTRTENGVTQLRLQARLGEIENRLKNIEIDLSATRKTAEDTKNNLNKLTETVAESFHETWARMDGENARITRLEEAADLTHRN